MVLTLNRQPIIKTRTLQELRKLVFTFATQLAKHINKEQTEMTFTWSQILKIAWVEIKLSDGKYKYKEFIDTKGKLQKRIALASNWSDTHTVKGTGRPTPEGMKLYTDAAKNFCNMAYDTGSYYENNLIQTF